MKDIIAISEAVHKRACEIIKDMNFLSIWESVGAEVHIIGSAKTGLMMKHRDIDINVYSEPLNVSESFRAMAKIAENPAIKRVEYNNNTDPEGNHIEWHAWYYDTETGLWKIDILHILKGSAYHGYMEKLTERMIQVMTPEMKRTILQLKYDTPEDVRIHGIEYYQAVIRDGVKSYDELIKWRKENPEGELIKWMP